MADPGSYVVTVKRLCGDTLKVAITNSTSVTHFRHSLAARGVPVDARLICDGRILDDQCTMAQYHVTDQSIIYAVLRMGMMHVTSGRQDFKVVASPSTTPSLLVSLASGVGSGPKSAMLAIDNISLREMKSRVTGWSGISVGDMAVICDGRLLDDAIIVMARTHPKLEVTTIAKWNARSSSSPSSPSTPSSSSSPSPSSSSTPLSAAFVADITIPDGTVMAPGTPFIKEWQLRNSGTVAWSGCVLLPSGAPVVVGGEAKSSTSTSVISFGAGKTVVNVADTAGGALARVSVSLTSPMVAGHYRQHFRLHSSTGVAFGPSIFVEIVVKGTAAPSREAIDSIDSMSVDQLRAEVLRLREENANLKAT